MHSSESDLSAHPSHAIDVRHLSDPARIAFPALLHVPVPLLVLSSQKRVVLANYAVGELLGLDAADGRTWAELGIRIAPDEGQKWHAWEV